MLLALLFHSDIASGQDTLPQAILSDFRLSFLAKAQKITPALAAQLEEEKIKSSYFSVLRDTNSRLACERLSLYDEDFKAAGDSFNVRPELLKSICYVESYGRAEVKSHSKAVGIAQFIPSAGEQYGLVKYQRKKLKSGKTQKILIYDHRTDPHKSIWAQARLIRDLLDANGGDESLAIWSYHCGGGNMSTIKKLARTEFGDTVKLSVSRIYFGAKRNGALYNKINSLKDNSTGYYFHVKAAENLLALDSLSYAAMYMRMRNLEDPRKRAPYKFFSWYNPDTIPYQTAEELDSALARKELFVFSVRKNQGNVPLKTDFCGLPETVGAYMTLDILFKASDPVNYRPLKLLSMTEISEEPIIDTATGRNFLQIQSFGTAFAIESPKLLQTRLSLLLLIKRMNDLGFLSSVNQNGQILMVIPPDENIRAIYRNVLAERPQYVFH